MGRGKRGAHCIHASSGARLALHSFLPQGEGGEDQCLSLEVPHLWLFPFSAGDACICWHCPQVIEALVPHPPGPAKANVTHRHARFSRSCVWSPINEQRGP